ncbi:MAG: PAS domain-containing protein, partial [Candidatus Eremiobacteraeota bacterium]|nr:PAS domain-containing protein [Candidatus Eremiobacteraeota bacterium]
MRFLASDMLTGESRFARLIEAAPVAIFVRDREGRQIYSNEHFSRLSGISTEAAFGFGWRDVVHPDDLPRYDVALGQAGERDGEVQLDVRRRRPDGYFAWMRVTLQRINEPVGTFGVVGTVVDIDELMQLGQAVSESRERFHFLAEAMPQLVWSGASDGTIDYLNRRFIEYTGWTAERLAAESVPGIVHPEDRERTVRAWRESLSQGSEYEVEYRLRRASDGAYRWFIARAVPMRDESGKIVQWIGTATDVDAQRRSYENLQFAV